MAGGGVAFLFDANLSPRLAEALRSLGEQAYHVNDRLGPGAPDELWIEYAGTRGWCIISADLAITRRDHERAALRQHQVGAFFLFPGWKRRPDFCLTVQTIIRHWPAIKRCARERARLFIVGIRERGGLRPL